MDHHETQIPYVMRLPSVKKGLLELNSNPYVHPYVYPRLLRAVKEVLSAAHEQRMPA